MLNSIIIVSRISFLCILLFSCTIYSQTKGNSIIISLKGAYHTADRPDQFDGYNSGLLFDGTCELSLTSNLFASFNLVIGGSTDKEFPVPLYKNIERDYSFFGINGILKYRVFSKKFGFAVGVGIGNMDIKNTSELGINKYSYLNFNTTIAINYTITKGLFIETEISYYNLSNFDRTNKMFLFKIGPALFLK